MGADVRAQSAVTEITMTVSSLEPRPACAAQRYRELAICKALNWLFCCSFSE
jgi:hypothetical protein